MERESKERSLTPVYRRPRFLSVFFSVFFHVALILGAMFLRISEPFAAPVEEMLHFNVKSVDTRPLLLKYTSPATNPDSTSNSRRFIRDALKGFASAPKDVPIDELVSPEFESKKQDAQLMPKIMELGEADQDKKPEIQSLLTHMESEHLQDDVQVQKKTPSGASDILKMVQRHKTSAGNLVQSLEKPLDAIGMGGEGNINLDPEEGMPGFTPIEGTYGNSTYDQGGGIAEKGDVTKYESLDDFLDIRVTTYQDPKDSQKYFMIKIFTRKDIKTLHVMPKEIIFAIDCSLSISPERLDEFKKGIGNCLKNLNKDDLFNIVAFQDKAILFRPASVSADPQTIEEAERFVSELKSNRTTDVYTAMENIIKGELPRKPSNVILISDGRPTHGIVNSRELIGSITRLNSRVRPIFAYSGGAKVNRYLLDFISYQNRAWSQFVKERGQIQKGLADFYSKIKDPIFLDLRYQLNGVAPDEVFPKTLPDFYRNAEFTLYGKYVNENDISMQLLGDVDGQTKELVFSRSLNDAEKGGPEIMKGYAFNKVYHLISELTTQGQNPQLLGEIRSLSQNYGVTTPYSTELENTD